MSKPMLSLLPWDTLTDVAELMTNHGADKHPLEGWKQRDSREHLDSALRHLVAHMTGTETDDESGRRHIIHAAARILMLAYTTKGADNE